MRRGGRLQHVVFTRECAALKTSHTIDAQPKAGRYFGCSARLPGLAGARLPRWHPPTPSRFPPPPTSTPPRKSSPASRSARRSSIRRCSMRGSARGCSSSAETLQRTGSFKFRGAYNKISSIPPDTQGQRRGRLFVRQSRAGRGACGGALQHAGGDRDAVGRAEGQARAHRGARRRGRAVRPRHRGPRGDRPRHRAKARRGAGAAVRRSVRHRRAGHGGPRDLRGPGEARAEARRGGGRRVGRRADRRHRARHEGARAGREVLFGRAGGLRRHHALVQERPAREQPAHERHDLRRADDRARRASITWEINRRLVGRGREPRATTRSAARWRLRSAN